MMCKRKNFCLKIWKIKNDLRIIAAPNKNDSVAQSVEHYTFNVRVPGSSPGGITQ